MFNSPMKDNHMIGSKDGTIEIGETLHDAAHNAGRKARGMLNSAKDELTHARDYMGAEIRSNPVRSSMIALGVGLLLGTVFRR